MKSRQQINVVSKLTWVVIAGICFLLCLVAAVLLILFGSGLERLGIARYFYYLILVPLGFAAAAFLGGAMKSYAEWKSGHKIAFGEMHLKGPVAIFFLVIAGGFILPNYMVRDEFVLKFRIVSPGRGTDSFNEGSVILYYGNKRRQEKIASGIVTIDDIPRSFMKTRARMELAGLDQYELTAGDSILIPDKSEYVNVTIDRKRSSLKTAIRGNVTGAGNVPLKHAILDFDAGKVITRTDEYGNFSVTLPYPEGHVVKLTVRASSNELKYDEVITLSSITPLSIPIH